LINFECLEEFFNELFFTDVAFFWGGYVISNRFYDIAFTECCDCTALPWFECSETFLIEALSLSEFRIDYGWSDCASLRMDFFSDFLTDFF
jgi:hypothetical protein